MTKVAADYEISDVAPNKICLKHRIPVPGRGMARKCQQLVVVGAVLSELVSTKIP